MFRRFFLCVLSLILSLVFAGTAKAQTIETNLKTWQKVATNGIDDPDNETFYMAVSFKGYMYAGTGNEGGSGAMLYRSSDGANWIRIAEGDFNDTNDIVIIPFIATDNYLYVGTADSTNGGGVWRTSDGVNFTQINQDGFGSGNNDQVTSGAIYNNSFHAGTYNTTDGAAVWRFDGPDVGDWTKVSTDGFGASVGEVLGLETIDSYLYAGTWRNAGGGQLYRYNGSSWAQVGGDGLGNTNNSSIYMTLGERFQNYLYVGTYNTADGASIYRSADGVNWNRFGEVGFGDSNNILLVARTLSEDKVYFASLNSSGCLVYQYGSPIEVISTRGFGSYNDGTITGGLIFGDYLYVAPWNDVEGGQIWRTFVGELPQTGENSELINYVFDLLIN